MTTRPLPNLGTTVGFGAHFDDIFYAAAGLFRHQALLGNLTASISATRGEAGILDPSRWAPEELPKLREQEEIAAFGRIGVKDIRVLEHPDGRNLLDGGLHTVSQDIGVQLVLQQLIDLRPGTVITYGPDGLTGHSDHIAVSAWTTDAFDLYLLMQPKARLYYVAANGNWPSIASVLREAKAIYAEAEVHTTGRLAIDYLLEYEALMAKYAGIKAYESQSQPLIEAIGGDLRRLHLWIRRESFRRVR